jgi:hypothetical protein
MEPEPRLLPSVEVVLEPKLPPDNTRVRDVTGLVVGFFELGLVDIRGVVPRVAANPPSPGLQGAAPTVAERWVVSVEVDVGRTDVVVQVAICPHDRPCERKNARAPVEDPAPAVYILLDHLATVLDRPLAPGAREHQVARGSADPYALRLAGRAASSWYTWIPPSDYPGDARRDPIARAVLVDPSMPVAGWFAARDARRREQPAAVHGLLERPRMRRPSSLALAADDASAWAAAGRIDAAAVAWAAVRAVDPADPRWIPESARVLLALDRRAEAEGLLNRLPDIALADPEIAALRVEAVEGSGFDVIDDRLRQWAETDPGAAEPIRRRVRLRIDANKFEDALGMLAELERRGGALEARALRPALLAAADRWQEAAEVVEDPALAARLRERAAIRSATVPPE